MLKRRRPEAVTPKFTNVSSATRYILVAMLGNCPNTCIEKTDTYWTKLDNSQRQIVLVAAKTYTSHLPKPSRRLKR